MLYNLLAIVIVYKPGKKYEQSSHLGKLARRVYPQVFCSYKSVPTASLFSRSALGERGVLDPAREEIL